MFNMCMHIRLIILHVQQTPQSEDRESCQHTRLSCARNDIKTSRARYLVAPEQMERPGPKHAAVESEEEEERLYQDAIVDEEGERPPGYT